VAAVFRQAEKLPVGEPGELCGELVALARGCPNGHGKTILEHAGDDAFQPSDMIDIGDHPLANGADDRGD